jgi:hypothetical protein
VGVIQLKLGLLSSLAYGGTVTMGAVLLRLLGLAGAATQSSYVGAVVDLLSTPSGLRPQGVAFSKNFDFQVKCKHILGRSDPGTNAWCEIVTYSTIFNVVGVSLHCTSSQ